jgi:hypothetical protein
VTEEEWRVLPRPPEPTMTPERWADVGHRVGARVFRAGTGLEGTVTEVAWSRMVRVAFDGETYDAYNQPLWWDIGHHVFLCSED